MRIIQGKFKGFRFPPFQGPNTRPSSDLAKESLFNTLEGFFDFSKKSVIDLFAGTGNIGLECISRGADQLISVDHMPANIKYMKALSIKLNIDQWRIIRSDALIFADKNTIPAQLVFADPPYDYPYTHELVNHILDADWYKKSEAIFVLEHVDRLVFNHKNVFLNKQYGNTAFTFFK